MLNHEQGMMKAEGRDSSHGSDGKDSASKWDRFREWCDRFITAILSERWFATSIVASSGLGFLIFIFYNSAFAAAPTGLVLALWRWKQKDADIQRDYRAKLDEEFLHASELLHGKSKAQEIAGVYGLKDLALSELRYEQRVVDMLSAVVRGAKRPTNEDLDQNGMGTYRNPTLNCAINTLSSILKKIAEREERESHKSAEIYEVDLARFNLTGTSFFRYAFVRISLRDALLVACRFDHCCFVECSFSGARLLDAEFRNCKFYMCDISKEQFDPAEGPLLQNCTFSDGPPE